MVVHLQWKCFTKYIKHSQDRRGRSQREKVGDIADWMRLLLDLEMTVILALGVLLKIWMLPVMQT